jgi:putative redox protein
MEWDGGLRFAARAGGSTLALDGDGANAFSPVQALLASPAGCMSADVVHILSRGRVPLEHLSVELEALRAEDDPRRLVAVTLRFSAVGEVPHDRIERAVALSRERYCSVWHSLRPDIDFRTSFEVTRAPVAGA